MPLKRGVAVPLATIYFKVLKVYINPKQSSPSLQPVTVMYIKNEGTVDVRFTVESPTTPSPTQ